MKESNMFREYARVVDMCEGTAVMPYHCVRFNGKDFDPNTYWFGVPGLLACDPVVRGEITFAVCIIENKPVFRLDRLYVIRTGEGFEVGAIHDNETMIQGHCDDGTQCWFNTESLTWNKPSWFNTESLTWNKPKPKKISVGIATPHNVYVEHDKGVKKVVLVYPHNSPRATDVYCEIRNAMHKS